MKISTKLKNCGTRWDIKVIEHTKMVDIMIFLTKILSYNIST